MIQYVCKFSEAIDIIDEFMIYLFSALSLPSPPPAPNKTAGIKAKKSNERMFHDLATVKPPPSLDMSISEAPLPTVDY